MHSITRYAWRSPLFVVGLFVLLVSLASAIGLALAGIVAWHGDPRPNLVGFGFLMVVATAIGIAMVGVGLSRARKTAGRVNGEAA
jgi:hypothetical protein